MAAECGGKRFTVRKAHNHRGQLLVWCSTCEQWVLANTMTFRANKRNTGYLHQPLPHYKRK